MSFTSDFLVGLAEHLAAEGVGVWNPSGKFSPSDTGIVIRTMPQGPDRIVSLQAYSVADEVLEPTTVQGVQILTRAGSDPREVEDLDDALFDLLHGARALRLHGIAVILVARNSSAPLGPDGNNRQQSTNNYYFTLKRPSRHRTD